MSLKRQITDQGYAILNDVFTKEELASCENEINHYIRNNSTFKNAGGISIPDFIKKKELYKTSLLKDNKKIQTALLDIFGSDNYRFCSHNDIGINRVVGWHKDKLNGEYAKYQSHNIWKSHQGQSHEIVKVLIYLQDHTNNKDGLQVVPRSHRGHQAKKVIHQAKKVILQPKLGDVIVFDQRITHRGMEKKVKGSRILVSFGFGKNNIFTDEFEKGTMLRQNKQNKQNK